MIFFLLSARFENPQTLTIHFWNAGTFKNSRNGLVQACFRSKDCTSPPIGDRATFRIAHYSGGNCSLRMMFMGRKRW